MRSILLRRGLPALLALIPLSPSPVVAQTSGASEYIEVTATRVPEDLRPVAASISVVTGDELRRRNATDLASALSGVAGVAIAPGGDGGPASSVPELWGLREFDAFLLVVDGVPWGGAFNPALASLDLTNVERIEILRGAAPVMYGATSFVGVIHVIHRAAGAAGSDLAIGGGSFGSARATASFALPGAGAYRQSLSFGGERHGEKDDDAGFDRAHVLYRGALETGAGRLRVDLDATILRQDPASPHPRTGRVLTDLVPIDFNANPDDGRIDENRYHLVLGWERDLAHGSWSTTLATTKTEVDVTRGFLRDVEAEPVVADGYRQEQSFTDVYFDSHVAWRFSPAWQVVAGIDHLFGKGEQQSENFEYEVDLDSGHRPDSHSLPIDEATESEDERNFSGLYLQTEWMPTPAFRLEAGARLNHTSEKAEGEADEAGGEVFVEEDKAITRGSGALGASWRAWEHDGDELWVFADWRNTYKPAAVDFGPESEAEILDPETARSFEVGLKGHCHGGGMHFELSAFRMDFENLVIPTVVDGRPSLENAGEERFQGIELETGGIVASSLKWRLGGAWHDAKFRDYLRDFDGVPMQLSGKRLEMSANWLGSARLEWAPPDGFFAGLGLDYTGDRYLNKRNTALAPSFTTWSAGAGYATSRWEVRVDGRNLSDERDPVAESELGDAQYYRLSARRIEGTIRYRF